MDLFKKKRPQISREGLLRAKPVRNPQAELAEMANGNLELGIPFEKPRGLRWFFRSQKVFTRRFELDGLGRKVWDLCDGEHTVRQLIETFSKSEGLNLREAEVSMITYLETLGKRGIIFMTAEKPPSTR
jgi:hypothetical protein